MIVTGVLLAILVWQARAVQRVMPAALEEARMTRFLLDNDMTHRSMMRKYNEGVMLLDDDAFARYVRTLRSS